MSSIMRWRSGLTVSVVMGKLLSGVRLQTPRSSRQSPPPATAVLSPVTALAAGASPRSGLSRSDFVHWPESAAPTGHRHVRFLRCSRRTYGEVAAPFLTHLRHRPCSAAVRDN